MLVAADFIAVGELCLSTFELGVGVQSERLEAFKHVPELLSPLEPLPKFSHGHY